MPVGVVAQGYRVDSGVKQLAGGSLGDADPARGVLAVGDHEVGAMPVTEAGQQRGEGAPPGPPYHVPNEEEPHCGGILSMPLP